MKGFVPDLASTTENLLDLLTFTWVVGVKERSANLTSTVCAALPVVTREIRAFSIVCVLALLKIHTWTAAHLELLCGNSGHCSDANEMDQDLNKKARLLL